MFYRKNRFTAIGIDLVSDPSGFAPKVNGWTAKFLYLVEPDGIEPTTSSMPLNRSDEPGRI